MASDDSEQQTNRRDAWEEDECLLCAPAPHQNCEADAVVQFVDPERVPLGDDHGDHLVSVPVCLEHHRALRQFQQGRNVAEVR